MAPSQRRRAPARSSANNVTVPLFLLLPSLLLVCLPAPTHALDFQDIRDGFSGASDDIKKGMDGLRLPGMCAYYDPIHDRCHVDSKNGIRTEVAGPCGDNMKGIVPTCRGHPDAYMPQPQGPLTPATPLPAPPKTTVEVGPGGEVTGTTTPPPPPKPTTNPPAQAPTTKDITGTPSRWPFWTGKDSTEPVEDVEEEEKERKGKGLKGFALFGLLIGAAVFAAVLSVLGVGYYAYRIRQKTMRRREQVFTAREARTQANVMFAGTPSSLPSIGTPRSMGL